MQKIAVIEAMLMETARMNGIDYDLINEDNLQNEDLENASCDEQWDHSDLCAHCLECNSQDCCDVRCDTNDNCDDENEAENEAFWEAFRLLIASYRDSFGSYFIKDAKILRNTKKRTTTVIWSDGTVTVVKAAKGEKMNDYHAFTAAFAKRMLGSNTKINHIVEKTVEMQLSPKKK